MHDEMKLFGIVMIAGVFGIPLLIYFIEDIVNLVQKKSRKIPIENKEYFNKVNPTVNTTLEEFKKYSEEVTKTQDSSREHLIKCGINNNDGTLTEKYGGDIINRQMELIFELFQGRYGKMEIKRNLHENKTVEDAIRQLIKPYEHPLKRGLK